MAEFGLITIGTACPDGSAVYRVWAIERDRLETLAERLGPPHEEHVSSAEELALSNSLVASFDVPPIINHRGGDS